MANSFAYIALFLWVLISIYFFSVKSLQKAILYTLMGAFLFLPVGTNINLPFVPAFNKENLSVMSVLFGCLILRKQTIPMFKGVGWASICFIGLLVGSAITGFTNSDSIQVGPYFLPALTSHDAMSNVVNQYLAVVTFFIGIKYFQTYESQLFLFRTLVMAALIYSLIILFEARFSPQLHKWIYGYFPHSDFAQQIRFGGFRPVGFIGHGLTVSFFIVISLFASYSLYKNNVTVILKKTFGHIYLSIILIVCKSVGSFLYGIFGVIIMMFLNARRILIVSMIIATLALFYPLLKITDTLPTESILDFAYQLNSERAGSLEFRLNNENSLLKKANEKLYFGWGGWGRNRVYDQSGKDVSVSDGRWIIQYGQYGLLGFIFYFTLMYLPIVNAFKNRKSIVDSKQLNLLAGHSLIISILMVDQLLNSSIVPLYWLIAGSLYGRAKTFSKHEK